MGTDVFYEWDLETVTTFSNPRVVDVGADSILAVHFDDQGLNLIVEQDLRDGSERATRHIELRHLATADKRLNSHWFASVIARLKALASIVGPVRFVHSVDETGILSVTDKASGELVAMFETFSVQLMNGLTVQFSPNDDYLIAYWEEVFPSGVTNKILLYDITGHVGIERLCGRLPRRLPSHVGEELVPFFSRASYEQLCAH